MKKERKSLLTSIVVIVPYFGKLPNFFNLWLESCKYNPTIDWFIFTDDRTEFNYPQNVKVQYFSFDEIKEKFQKNFDFKISIPNPYKLTDFKPTYGLVFNEYIKSYDYWGFGDIDLIYGNIRNFITNSILENHDKILCHGHFTLLKNNAQINTIYKKEINEKVKYKEVYSTEKHFGFDEYGDEAFHSICKNELLDIYINNLIFADINSWKRHFSLTYVRRVCLTSERKELEWEENNQKHSSVFVFNKGKLIRIYIKDDKIQYKEYMYVHFQKRKMENELYKPENNQFLIVPNKFVDFIENINKANLKKLGGKKFFSNRRIKRQIRVKIRTFILKYFGI